MKKVVLFGVPEHGNMGDIAIAYAEAQFLKDKFKDYEILEIPDNDIDEKMPEIKDKITDEDILFGHGGGNLGDKYLLYEKRRRAIIDTFPNNKIIIMPQTIHFSDTEKGKAELEESKKLYKNHKNLTMIAREEVSYEIMKKEFDKVNVILTPDIVMYLNKTNNAVKREGVTLFMRNDVEKVLTEADSGKIKNVVLKYYDNILHTDTHIGDEISITKELREEMLETKWQEAREAELVITDRLHGMIFAAITSTPCIAFGNYNHKIQSSFKWLKDLNYIKYIEDIGQLEECVKELQKLEETQYNNEFAQKLYNEILKYV